MGSAAAALGAAPDLERDALIPHLFGQSSACSAKKEHFEYESYGAPAQISAGFRKAEQIGSGRCPGSRGRRFKSCQPDKSRDELWFIRTFSVATVRVHSISALWKLAVPGNPSSFYSMHLVAMPKHKSQAAELSYPLGWETRWL
jgi:hypothetical protein